MTGKTDDMETPALVARLKEADEPTSGAAALPPVVPLQHAEVRTILGTMGASRVWAGWLARALFLALLMCCATGCKELVGWVIESLFELFALMFLFLCAGVCGLLGFIGLMFVALPRSPPTWAHLVFSWLAGMSVAFVSGVLILGIEASNRDTAFGGSACMALATPMLVWPAWATARKVGSSLEGGLTAIPFSIAAALTLGWTALLYSWADSSGVFDVVGEIAEPIPSAGAPEPSASAPRLPTSTPKPQAPKSQTPQIHRPARVGPNQRGRRVGILNRESRPKAT